MIRHSAFLGCASLTSVTIPDSVTEIETQVFEDCTSLTSITIPDSVTEMGNSVFSDCASLTSVNIPDGVTEIGSSVFWGCTSLTSVTIPESVTEIAYGAFSNCTSLTSIIIPDSVTTIGGSAFRDCTSLTSIVVSENNQNYKSIDGSLYTKDGTTLVQYAIGKTDTAFTIPDSVTTIGERAFDGCTSLTSIVVSENNQKYKSIDGNLYSKDGTTLVQYAIGKTDTAFTLPDSVIWIRMYAFSDCTNLTSIIIPDSVIWILRDAFYGCTSLTSVTIGNGVTTIGSWAFDSCTNLTIYAEATAKPSGWVRNWNPDDRPVEWGYTGE